VTLTAGKIRVVIADDHALFRAAVESVLDTQPDIEVVGQAGDGREATRLALALRPDLVLMDVRMPVRDGIEATRDITEAAPGVKVLMLTGSDEEEDLSAAIKAGACGYLLKAIEADEMPAAVRAAHAGQSLISPAMASKLMVEFAALARKEQEPADRRPQLTDRELEVLGLITEGLQNKDIASRLFISENTVKNHVRNILEKLQLRSRMEAVFYAVRTKLFEIK